MYEDGTTTEAIETAGDEGFEPEAGGGIEEGGNVESEVDAGAEDVDPWESLKTKGYDPEALEKSFTRFTTELESVKEKERSLQPYMELQSFMESDPRILDALEQVLNAPAEGETEIDAVRRELSAVQQQLATEKELESLRKYTAENDGFPDVDDRAVIQHAIANRIGNLQTAYRDLNFEAIREAERKRAFDEVKGVRKARAVTTSASESKGVHQWTREEIAALSPADFEKNSKEIFAYYDSTKGK